VDGEGNIMTEDYHFIQDLKSLATEIPPDTIISRTFHEDELLKTILFGFAEGQELSEHTASQPAMIQFLEGDAILTIGEDEYRAQAGTWVQMPAKLPHSILATSKLLMLLTLYKGN
jgi:quercetin dioxygenase-like cupin family protein